MNFNFVRSVSVSARAGSEVRHHAGNRIEISRGELKGVCLNLSLGLRVGQPVPSIAAGFGKGHRGGAAGNGATECGTYGGDAAGQRE